MTLLIAPVTAETQAFAQALDAGILGMPPASPAGDWAWAAELEAWRDSASQGRLVPNGLDRPFRSEKQGVVVAVWPESPAPGTALDLDAAGWEARAEQPLARWAAALGCAVLRCPDDGSIVAVVDGPTTLECAGWAPETAVAEGVRAMVRSLALSEGARGVRVNTVSTPARLPLEELLHPAPPLATFPGTLDREVAGAVRMLLSEDACGITGSMVFADAGRAWR